MVLTTIERIQKSNLKTQMVRFHVLSSTLDFYCFLFVLASKDGWLSYPVWPSNLSWTYISLSNSFKLLQVLNLYSPEWVIFMFLSHTVKTLAAFLH